MKYFTQTDQASPINVELAADLKGIKSSQKFYKYVVYFSHEILVAMSEKKRKFEKCTKIVLWVYTWIKLACWHFSIEHFISGCLCEAVWILTCQFKSVSVSQRYLDSESITWRLIWHQERNSELHGWNQNQSINICSWTNTIQPSERFRIFIAAENVIEQSMTSWVKSPSCITQSMNFSVLKQKLFLCKST